MDEMEIEVPIYLVTGFLESGKTSFVDATVSADYFQIDEPTLIISCEEGEIEYNKSELLKYNTVLECIDEPEDFTFERLKEIGNKYKPDRIILEYNPLWSIKKLYEMDLPKGWGIIQHIVTVDASTFSVYMNNMKSLFMEMSTNADMVVFNRCEDSSVLAGFRRSIKVVNPGADIIFEDKDNMPIDIFEDDVPYDTDADVIEIEDVDYGIFYVDMNDNPDKYKGKTVKFRGAVLKSKQVPPNLFVPGRKAMTCCADDIRYIGFVCKSSDVKNLKAGGWVMVTATVSWEFSAAYGKEGPVLTATELTPCDPPASELVYFN